MSNWSLSDGKIEYKICNLELDLDVFRRKYSKTIYFMMSGHKSMNSKPNSNGYICETGSLPHVL